MKKGNSFISIIVFIIFFSANITPISYALSSTQKPLDIYNEQQNDQDLGISHYAIIIGVEEYQYINERSRINIDETAQDVYNQLITGSNYTKQNTRLLLNKNATKNNIKNTILSWLSPLENKEDVILFYFIGHTEKTTSGTIFGANTLSYCYDSTNSTEPNDKITDKELDSWLDQLDSKHIALFFDTSYTKNMHSLPQLGRIILGSTGNLFPKTNPSDPSLSHTIFSHFVINGLKGYADEDSNGIISINELFSYTKTNCIQHSMQTFIDKIKQLDFRFHPQFPSISNRHLGAFSLFNLTFGWKQLTDNGFGKQSNYATRGITIFKGELYIGTQNNLLPKRSTAEEHALFLTSATLIPDFYDLFGDLTTLPSRLAMHFMTFVSQGCELWKYNYTTDSLTKVIGTDSLSGISAGFGSHFNAAAAVLYVFKDKLYVGTWNTPLGSMKFPDRKGCELWRSSDGIHWEQVVGNNAPFTPGGFGNPDNTGAWSIESFNDYLYVGTMNWDFSDTGGCEVWRSKDGLHWEQVVDHGFRPFMNSTELEKEAINTYAWNMEVYHDYLYMGTFNSRIWLMDEKGTGCQLWRTNDGVNWEKVLLPNGLDGGFQDGFGEGENYGIRRMIVYNDELYCGVASSFFHEHGCEIWKYDGNIWTPIVSDEIVGIGKNDARYDGFGNSMNKYVWSMVVTNDNTLWIGTGNGQVYLPFFFKGGSKEYFTTDTEGCEIWCYDGSEWNPIIKNDVGLKPNGMGNQANLGARSMIEYPKDSGNIVVGTFKLFNPIPDQKLDGCELWLRYTS